MNKETNRMIDEDIELYSLFRKGDRKAFDTLFLKYYSGWLQVHSISGW